MVSIGGQARDFVYELTDTLDMLKFDLSFGAECANRRESDQRPRRGGSFNHELTMQSVWLWRK